LIKLQSTLEKTFKTEFLDNLSPNPLINKTYFIYTGILFSLTWVFSLYLHAFFTSKMHQIDDVYNHYTKHLVTSLLTSSDTKIIFLFIIYLCTWRRLFSRDVYTLKVISWIRIWLLISYYIYALKKKVNRNYSYVW
jgi:hypothetical protein